MFFIILVDEIKSDSTKTDAAMKSRRVLRRGHSEGHYLYEEYTMKGNGSSVNQTHRFNFGCGGRGWDHLEQLFSRGVRSARLLLHGFSLS